MCGLLFTNDPGVDRQTFLRALELLDHRGPDAAGYVQIGGSQLGHRRLKILDLDNRSNQPFYSSDGRYVLLFNGEIYNYRELAKQFSIEQRTKGDAEVLLELFAKVGPNSITFLNGMFAFVIVDTVSEQIFAARDRLGVKPLFTHTDGTHLTLSSEISPILQLARVSTFDEFSIRQYRKLRTFFNGRTIYRGIEMFPAGHYLHEGKMKCYWRLPESVQPPPSDDELHDLICRSIHQRLVSDVPVGSFLSGGLDSTIVAAVSDQKHTWTVGFPGFNEFQWSSLAAQHLGTDHHTVLIDRDEFVHLAKLMIQKRREPLSVPNEVLLYRMALEVKKLNTVILSGEGADELFFGYDRIFRWAAGAKSWDLRQFSSLYAYGMHDDLEVVEDALAPFLHRQTPLEIVAHFFQTAHLHGLLRRLDSSTMLCSVEARVPFVDYHPLIERMAGVPFDFRMHDGVVKAPLKRIFRHLVPREILDREKVGFPVPLDSIPFGAGRTDKNAMDQWFDFNLAVLGCLDESRSPTPSFGGR